MLRRRRKYLGHYHSREQGWWHVWHQPMPDHFGTEFLVSRRRFLGRKLWGYWYGMVTRFHEDDLKEISKKIEGITRGN